MCSDKQRENIVHYKNKQYKFIKCKDGLYYFGTTNNDTNNISVTNYYLLTTVKGNEKYYTSKEIEVADKARSLQE